MLESQVRRAAHSNQLTLTEARALLDRPLDLDRDPPLHRQREQLAVVGGERRRRPHVVRRRASPLPLSHSLDPIVLLGVPTSFYPHTSAVSHDAEFAASRRLALAVRRWSCRGTFYTVAQECKIRIRTCRKFESRKKCNSITTVRSTEVLHDFRIAASVRYRGQSQNRVAQDRRQPGKRRCSWPAPSPEP